MSENFKYGILALANEIKLFMVSILHNKVILGFIFGIFLTVIIVGFIITKNPSHIPVMLQYSPMEGFQKLSERDTNGTYNMSYSQYTKMHNHVRMLFMTAIIAFCIMVTTIVIRVT